MPLMLIVLSIPNVSIFADTDIRFVKGIASQCVIAFDAIEAIIGRGENEMRLVSNRSRFGTLPADVFSTGEAFMHGFIRVAEVANIDFSLNYCFAHDRSLSIIRGF